MSTSQAEMQTLPDVKNKQSNPTTRSRGNIEGVLKPNNILTNRGGKSSSHSSDGMLLVCFEYC